MTAGKQAGQYALDDLVVADDRLADLLLEQKEFVLEFRRGLFHGRVDIGCHIITPVYASIERFVYTRSQGVRE